MSTITDIIGWTTVENVSTFLETIYGASSWATAAEADQIALTTTAFSELRDHPNYTIPDYGGSDWDALTSAPGRLFRA